MRLDVIVPTYNRRDLLARAIQSLLAAEVPAGTEVVVTVVDNNSTDGTRQVVEGFRERFPDRLNYRAEPRQGRSHAVNAGIAATSGELVGIIDDDEEVDPGWHRAAVAALRDGRLDFVGGPYVPRWTSPPPAWFPRTYRGVVGWVDGGNRAVPFDRDFPGQLMGGNAVLTRAVLTRVGPYRTWLGRTDKGLLSGEDEELYDRLLASGARGMYLPDLIIHHHVPPERVTKRYFRRWCFWRGVSLGLLERVRRHPVAYLLGIPRWQHRHALRGLVSAAKHLVVKPTDPAEAFTAELAVWDWLGLLYGRHVRRATPVMEPAPAGPPALLPEVG